MVGEAPRRGAFFIARVSEGRSPDDPGDGAGFLSPLDPARGRSSWMVARGSDTLSGSCLFMMINRFPGSSALRASTPGLFMLTTKLLG